MSEFRYKGSWPKDGIYTDCYAHQVQTFRYHWHRDEYELNILLHGHQHCFQGTDVYDLEENDVILINPNVGHASYSDPDGSIAFVLHFSVDALKPFVKKGQILSICSCLSDRSTRNEDCYRRLRMYAAETMVHLNEPEPGGSYLAKASMEMLIGTLCTMFKTESEPASQTTEESVQKIISTVINYMDEHYSEKITLEEIADLTGYNRTYVSTLFHQTVGIRFYDYLIRLRLQNAIHDLIVTDRSLTDIAIGSGFSDLKSFNTRFKSMLKILPSEYRAIADRSAVSSDYYSIRTIPYTDPLILSKLKEYTMR